MKTPNQVRAEITEILSKSEDRDLCLSVFDKFVSSHPGYVFMSKKERQKVEQDEEKMWSEIQPILDKAQHLTPPELEQLKAAREAHPLHRSDFTPDELEKMKRLAPEEYELLI